MISNRFVRGYGYHGEMHQGDDEAPEPEPLPPVREGEEWSYAKFAIEQRLVPNIKGRKLTDEQIEEVIDNAFYLKSLIRAHKLKPEQFDHVMDFVEAVWDEEWLRKSSHEYGIFHQALENQTWTPKHMNRLYEMSKWSPFTAMVLIPRMIALQNVDKGLIDRMIDDIGEIKEVTIPILEAIYSSDKINLTDAQRDMVVDKGIATHSFFQKYGITKEMISKLLDRVDEVNSETEPMLDWIFDAKDITDKQKDKVIEKGLTTKRFFQRFPKRCKKHIGRIIANISEANNQTIPLLNHIYSKVDLDNEQVMMVVDKGLITQEFLSRYTLPEKALEKLRADIFKNKNWRNLLTQFFNYRTIPYEMVEDVVKRLDRKTDDFRIVEKIFMGRANVPEEVVLNVFEFIETDKMFKENVGDANRRWNIFNKLFNGMKKIPSIMVDYILNGNPNYIPDNIYRTTYRNSKMSKEQIDKAIGVGKNLYYLVEYQKPSDEQAYRIIERIIEMGDYGTEVSILEVHKFEPEHVDKLLNNPKIDNIYVTRYQTLSPDLLDRILKSDEYINNILQFQTLSEEQIAKVWAKKNNNLKTMALRYQDVPRKYILKCLKAGTFLQDIYSTDKLNDDERIEVLKKMGYGDDVVNEIMRVPGELLRFIEPGIIKQFSEYFKKAIDNKVEENPLEVVENIHEIVPEAWQNILDILRSQKKYVKEDEEGNIDTRYAYYMDKQGREQRQKIGKILSAEIKKYPNKDKYADIYKDYNRICNFGIPKGEFDVVVSLNPMDIARKSTGQTWGSCETINHIYGWPSREGCGWCDDIRNNNAIGFIREKGSDKWLGRCMIRWCKRSDDGQLDAVIEKYYGNPKYTKMLVRKLEEIMTEAGFSANVGGNVYCEQPYPFTGYIDSGVDGAGPANGNNPAYYVARREDD